MLTPSPLLCIFLLSCFDDKLSKESFSECPDSCECYSAPKDGYQSSFPAFSVICKNISPVSQIKKLSKFSINTFGFVNMNVANLPDQYLSGLSINNLVFSNDPQYNYLFGSVNDPLSGMIVRDLKVLTFINMDLDSYNWRTLSNMQNLKAIHIEKGTLTQLFDYRFGSIKGENLISICIDDTGLTHIDYNLFIQWTNLKMLKITNNEIRDLQWIHNTLKLPHLWSLDLSNNEIEEIPSEFFTSFPALKRLKLDNNQIKFFPEKLIKPVLLAGKLNEFSFQGSYFCGHTSLEWLYSLNDDDPTIIYPNFFKYSIFMLRCVEIDEDMTVMPPQYCKTQIMKFKEWNCDYENPALP